MGPPARPQRVRRFAPGETIFREGDPSDYAYVIRSGRVDILKTGPAGAVRLALLADGDVFGEMGLLDERPRSASARAVDPVVAETVTPRDFMRRLVHEPANAIALLRALFERLRASNLRLTEPHPTAGDGDVPQVTLLPATPEAGAALPPEGLVVTRFPFRVGRRAESREARALSYNDLEVPDKAPFVLSPTHFALDLAADGVVVRDRGSQQGTVVNGVPIGARADRDVAPLGRGDNLIVAGGPRTATRRREPPFRFRVVVA